MQPSVHSWPYLDALLFSTPSVLTDVPGRFGVAAVATMLIAACGSVPRPGEAVPSPPTAALAAWQNFPANQVPRPIVLFGQIYPQGFRFADGDAKLAVECSKYALGVSLPPQVPSEAVATWFDGTSAKYEAISASDAFSAMSHEPPHVLSKGTCESTPPLAVTAVHFGPALWRTDRGTATISAWLFTASGAVGADLAYPAVAANAVWAGSTIEWSADSALVSADGLSLTFFFIGAKEGNGPCEGNYNGVVLESRTAVAISTVGIPRPPLSSPYSGACTAEGYPRSVKARLASPLGGRVLVDHRGAAVAVCRETNGATKQSSVSRARC